MKVSFDIPENDLKEVMQVTGEKKRAPAILKFVTIGLMVRRRRELAEEVASGKVTFELPHYEEMQMLDGKNSWEQL